MEIPFGHHHGHHERREEGEEKQRYPPPGYGPGDFPGEGAYTETAEYPPPHHHHQRPQGFGEEERGGSYSEYPPEPQSYPRPPEPVYSSVRRVSHEEGARFEPDPSGYGCEEAHPHRNPTSIFHHHQKGGEGSRVVNKPTVRVYSRAEANYSLSILDGKVILARSDPNDEFQHLIKDEKYSTRVKDEEGFPSFALVDDAYAQAIRHSIGATHSERMAHDEMFLQPSAQMMKEAAKTKPCTSLSSLVRAGRISMDTGVEWQGWKRMDDKGEKWKVIVGIMGEKWGSQLENAGIADALAISTLIFFKDTPLLLAALCYWNPTSKTFGFPKGEVTVTLEDVVMLSGLQPLGDMPSDELGPFIRGTGRSEEEWACLKKIEEELTEMLAELNRKKNWRVTVLAWVEAVEERWAVTQEQWLMGMLTAWISRWLMGSRQVRTRCIGTAIRLAMGERLGLGSMVLGDLYAGFDKFHNEMLQHGHPSGGVSLPGLGWILQLFLYERFPALAPKPSEQDKRYRASQWAEKKGSAPMQICMSKLQVETPVFRPYAKRCGTLRRLVSYPRVSRNVAVMMEGTEESILLWGCILTPGALKCLSGEGQVQYHPHLVARQFGFDQSAPGVLVTTAECRHPFPAAKLYGKTVQIPGAIRQGAVNDLYNAWVESRVKMQEAESTQWEGLVADQQPMGETSTMASTPRKRKVRPKVAGEKPHPSMGEKAFLSITIEMKRKRTTRELEQALRMGQASAKKVRLKKGMISEDEEDNEGNRGGDINDGTNSGNDGGGEDGSEDDGGENEGGGDGGGDKGVVDGCENEGVVDGGESGGGGDGGESGGGGDGGEMVDVRNLREESESHRDGETNEIYDNAPSGDHEANAGVMASKELVVQGGVPVLTTTGVFLPVPDWAGPSLEIQRLNQDFEALMETGVFIGSLAGPPDIELSNLYPGARKAFKLFAKLFAMLHPRPPSSAAVNEIGPWVDMANVYVELERMSNLLAKGGCPVTLEEVRAIKDDIVRLKELGFPMAMARARLHRFGESLTLPMMNDMAEEILWLKKKNELVLAAREKALKDRDQALQKKRELEAEVQRLVEIIADQDQQLEETAACVQGHEAIATALSTTEARMEAIKASCVILP